MRAPHRLLEGPLGLTGMGAGLPAHVLESRSTQTRMLLQATDGLLRPLQVLGSEDDKRYSTVSDRNRVQKA